MLYVIGIPAALILIFHDAAIGFSVPLRFLAIAALVILLSGVLAYVGGGHGQVPIAAVVLSYQLLLYVSIRGLFRRFEGRELQAALWNANLDRKLYIDWYWWVGWVVFALVLPTIVLRDV